MSRTKETDWNGVWEIFWRSFVYFPCMLLVFASVAGVWLGRWVVPFWGAFLLCLQEWALATVTWALWLVLIWAYRRFRLRRFFEAPPSLL
jgi:hypothetical protein